MSGWYTIDDIGTDSLKYLLKNYYADKDVYIAITMIEDGKGEEYMNNIYNPFYEVTSNTRELTESEKELQQLAKFMYENFPEYETASDESFFHKAIRILESLKSQLADIKQKREKIIEVIQKHTHIDMLAYSHQIDKSRPVPSCFVTTEDFENCVDEIIKVLEGK